MGHSLSKAEKTIALIALIAIAGFFAFFTLINKKTRVTNNFATESGIDYKMARPDQAYSDYTLEGREFDRLYEGLPPEVVKQKKAEAKKIADAKKKEETKKKEAAVAKTKTANTTASARQQAIAKANQKSQQAKDSVKKSTRGDVAQETTQPYVSNQSDAQNVVSDDVKVKPKKAFSEWRNEILADPTTENISAFIQAYKKGEITATEYQAMAQDLLDQDGNTLKGLGLQLLRSVPSLASLSQLVHAQAQLPATYQTYVEQSLIAYFYPQNLGYFKAALLTRDQVLQNKVLSVLQANLTRLSQGDTTVFNDPRNTRGNQVSVLTMQSFVSLLPALTSLSSSQVPELAQMATQVASLIQSYNNVAQN